MTVTIAAPGSQRMVLENVSWETYERLLADHIDQSAPRFSYDRGLLEIVMLGRDHEEDNRCIARLVWLVAAEIGIDLVDVGSMTYRRAAEQRGFEADSSFYIQHAGVARSEDFDVSDGPPPDLVIEIDASRSSLNKLDLYFRLEVPEVWIWELGRAKFFVRGSDRYDEVSQSRALPCFTTDVVTRLTEENRSLTSSELYRSIVAWARSL
ncbi:MAG: Uma2 family endonuclease [Chloroflexota bacterium]|nr:Uma2 family endonuclease [Chloroflexota bacterium]